MTDTQKAIKALDMAYQYQDHEDLGEVRKYYIKLKLPMVETILRALKLAEVVDSRSVLEVSLRRVSRLMDAEMGTSLGAELCILTNFIEVYESHISALEGE